MSHKVSKYKGTLTVECRHLAMDGLFAALCESLIVKIKKILPALILVG